MEGEVRCYIVGLPMAQVGRDSSDHEPSGWHVWTAAPVSMYPKSQKKVLVLP